MDSPKASNFDIEFLKKEFLDTLFVMIDFLKNPVIGMQNLPNWGWPKLIFLAGALSAVCGVFNAIASGVFFGIIAGLIIFPISTLLMNGILAGLFYYIFLFFYNRELSYQALFQHLVFASIPAVILTIVAPIIPPVTLLGVAATGIFLIVGFTANFKLPRKPITKLMSGLFLVYAVIWTLSSISFHQSQEEMRREYLPREAEEILKEEFG